MLQSHEFLWLEGRRSEFVPTFKYTNQHRWREKMTPKQSWVLKAAIIVVAALVGVVLGSLAMCYYYDLSFVEVWFE